MILQTPLEEKSKTTKKKYDSTKQELKNSTEERVGYIFGYPYNVQTDTIKNYAYNNYSTTCSQITTAVQNHSCAICPNITQAVKVLSKNT